MLALVRRCTALEAADFSHSGEGYARLTQSTDAEEAEGSAARRSRRPPQHQRPPSVGSLAGALGSGAYGGAVEDDGAGGAAVEREEARNAEEAAWSEEAAWVGSLRCGWEPLQLRRLSVRGWSRISQLELTAAERLVALNLGDCKQLLSLRLATPLLEQLTAYRSAIAPTQARPRERNLGSIVPVRRLETVTAYGTMVLCMEPWRCVCHPGAVYATLALCVEP